LLYAYGLFPAPFQDAALDAVFFELTDALWFVRRFLAIWLADTRLADPCWRNSKQG
jgi:hypothetical protein